MFQRQLAFDKSDVNYTNYMYENKKIISLYLNFSIKLRSENAQKSTEPFFWASPFSTPEFISSAHDGRREGSGVENGANRDRT